MVDSIPPVPAVTYAAAAPVVENFAPAPTVMQDVEKTIEIPQSQIIEQKR